MAPGIEGVVDDLKIEVGKLTTLKMEVGKIFKYWERSMVDAPSATLGVFAPAPVSPGDVILDSKAAVIPDLKSKAAVVPELKSAIDGDFQAAGRASAGAAAELLRGHRVNQRTQAGEFGVVTTLIPPPTRCPPQCPPPPPPPLTSSHWESGHQGGSGGGHTGKLPKFDFPRFDGDHPKIWIKQAVHYFALYRVESSVWVQATTMHFHSAAKRRLSSVEDQLESTTWPDFCAQLLTRFARDEHELLIRRLFQIRQSGPVSEYIDDFVALVDQLKAYAKHPDPLYYTQRFVDGLRDEIKAVILVQRPTTLDTACVLAQLQEEAMGLSKRPYRRYDSKPVWTGALPLPPPPPKLADGEVKRLTDTPHSTVEEKFQSLRASRRARGLCIRCGAKWSRDHKCSEVVQLHLVQELLDMFPDDEDEAEASSPASPTKSQLMLHLSMAAVAGASAPKTLCLKGVIQDVPLSILVDSDNSHMFLSTELAGSLHGVQKLVPAVQVQVANGAVLQCTSHISRASWSVQGYSFTTDLKLLPLTAYDMILGLDWLSSFSPMQVHWQQKWIAIPYNGQPWA
ncbi:unnamed protein product [Miscanthus lutarioriparius]|uniref:Retrotransposon gag domain-containing protein n=1 Tax=Miscanthus lutarioriparius TaxID=422564 RepID=A0A811MS44_9POAL|nr:unnamed protein product [Miscanthus lutarioriparius]